VSVLSFDAVTYSYAGAPEPALRELSLEIAHGQFVVLAGLSASGKSTLLRAASGLVPHFHGGTFAGRVVTGGLDTRDHGPGEVAAVAGTLFQDPETQCVLGTVRAELAFGLENRGLGAAAVARGVEEAALALGVEGLLDRPTHELSGGELQRVALGAALAGRPEVVLLDEPTSQLDPVAGDELVWLLRRLNEEWGTAIVLAEHRLERCLGAADRVVVLEDGALVCDAPPREFLAWAGERAPALQTPGARLFTRAGLRPLPAGVKEARATLRAHGLLGAPGARAATPTAPGTGVAPAAPVLPGGAGVAAPAGELLTQTRGIRALARAVRPRGRAADTAALRFADVWHEREGGRTVLRAVDLAVQPGERVALMGRNGAGKSTLLRHARGLLEPSRGRVTTSGRVALLLQHPGDYVLHEQLGQEASAGALAAAGLGHLDPTRHPNDLSGGERQRLALAVVLGDLDGDPPAVVCLDEPTRGMDRGAKGDLADRLRALGAGGAAVIVATHDAEFAAAVCERVVLLADGRPIADASASEVLSGGWYFATETARILGGAGGVLRPEEGAALLRSRLTLEPQP
jgi:energy-coupling factor transporter ATP-binding protein EcfA2